MTQFLDYAVPGVPFGCVFALMAVGLVLTYKASGVFNLAFGAQAFVSALAYVSLIQDDWPRWAAGVIAVLVIGPFVGVILDRLLFRRIRTASPLVKLVPSLGLLVALPQVALIIAGSEPEIPPPAIVGDAQRVYLHLGSVPISGLELSISACTVLVVGVLVVLFRFTPVGLEMRAVVESPRMTELAGVNAGRVSAFAWILSSVMAALAGVLLSPLYSQLDPQNFTVLLVWGVAGAVIGRFSSLPLALVGGLALGVAQQVVAGYMPAGVIANGLRPSLPFVVLLVFLPIARQRQLDDPLSACDPPSSAVERGTSGYRSASTLAAADGTVRSVGLWHQRLAGDAADGHPGLLTRRPTATLAWAVGALAVLSAVTWVPPDWLLTMNQGVAFAVVFLSLTLLTGMTGQISLCQATFAGLGGFVAGQLANHVGLPVVLGMLAGGLLAAGLGVLVALPTLRLAGLPLALATLAFALLADNILFPNSWIGNGAGGVTVPRPSAGPVSFAAAKPFFLLSLVVLAGASAVVKLVGDGTMGRYLAAVRGSELAASSVGVDVYRLRVLVFALSAALAGVGGALYGSLEGSLSPDGFGYQISAVLLVVVAIVGLRSIAGALVAGVVYATLQVAVTTLPSRFAGLVAVLFGLATLSYTRHPEGFLDFLGARTLEAVGRRRAARAATRTPTPGPGGTGGAGTAVAGAPVVPAGEGAG
ncbi:MAG TPA: ABC transporter permease [Acidimicrobiales bacterium]|nr:ABC transporter permease [Acidimicrobiales bacterium]